MRRSGCAAAARLPAQPAVDYFRRGPRAEEIFFVLRPRRRPLADRGIPGQTEARPCRRSASAVKRPEQPRLKRTLTLWDLVFYGIVLIQPTAPMGIFGVVSQEAHGHVVTTILIGMCAMLLTAMSYGRMARAYPSAGSAFTYVGQELHPALGYVTGWTMVMDYVLNPIDLHDLVQQAGDELPARDALPGLAGRSSPASSRVNLRGVKASARTNQVLARRPVRRRGRSSSARRSATCFRRAAPSARSHAPLLRSGDFLAAGRAHRRVNREPHLHRLRRHLDALGGGRRSRAATSCARPS